MADGTAVLRQAQHEESGKRLEKIQAPHKESNEILTLSLSKGEEPLGDLRYRTEAPPILRSAFAEASADQTPEMTRRSSSVGGQAQDEDLSKNLVLSLSKDESTALGDLRFRALLTAAEWAALPAPVRARFSRRLGAGDSVVYVGMVTACAISRVGWLFCQAARLIGAPLPLFDDTGIAAVVTVTEGAAGQVWTRMYARRRGFPQVIHSTKRFEGETGLEEYVGHGVGMALRVHVEDAVLLFRSAHYFVQVGRWRLTIPRALTPGRLTVSHRALGEDRFAFGLDIVHPLFGRIVHQTAMFEEATP